MAVLYGDPSKDGMFVIRAKLPANYRIPAHSHPTDEIVTVLSGTLMIGMGDKLVAANAKAFPAGSLIVAPAKANHFVLTKQPVVIQVSAMGPLQFNYVEPGGRPEQEVAGGPSRRLTTPGGKAGGASGWPCPLVCRPGLDARAARRVSRARRTASWSP